MATSDREAGRSSDEQAQSKSSPPAAMLLVFSGLLMALTFISEVKFPPGRTNDKGGQTNVGLRHVLPFVIHNIMASTGSSLYILELIVGRKFRTGFLYRVTVIGVAMSYAYGLVAISQYSFRLFAYALPSVTFLVLLSFWFIKARYYCLSRTKQH